VTPSAAAFVQMFNSRMTNIKLQVANTEPITCENVAALLVKSKKFDKIYFFQNVQDLLTSENIVNIASCVKDLALNLFEISNYKDITEEALENKKIDAHEW